MTSIDVPGAPVHPNNPDCEEFYPERLKPARHHDLICAVLQKVADGHLKRVMIFAPPGSAKSTYSSVCFPPFMMGRKKRTNIISVSYGSDLARKFGRKCRAIAKSPEYAEIFDTGLSNESSAADEWAMENGSEYMSGGILSGITGNRADGLLIDDPIKGQRDADSDAVRTSTWDAYKSDLFTRLKPNAWQIIIQTRWHQMDLAGQLLPDGWNGESGFVKGKDGHEWFVLCLPMMADRADDPLCREPGALLWNDWFVSDDVLAIKNSSHMQREWNSLYQQKPTAASGTYFKEEWFRWYDERPEHLRIYGASDYAITAKTSSDYTVHLVIGVDPDHNIYVLDVWRDQKQTDVSVDQFFTLIKDWKPMTWAEDRDQIINSIGPFINRLAHEKSLYVDRRQFAMGRDDKEMRAQSFKARMAMGKVYFPRHAPWLAEVKAEMLAFPTGRHDDAVDAMGLTGRLLDQMVGAAAPEVSSRRESDDYGFGSDSDGDGWKTA